MQRRKQTLMTTPTLDDYGSPSFGAAALAHYWPTADLLPIVAKPEIVLWLLAYCCRLQQTAVAAAAPSPLALRQARNMASDQRAQRGC